MTGSTTVTVPFTAEEFRRLKIVAEECGDSPVDFIRGISLATCTPKVVEAWVEGEAPAKTAKTTSSAKPSSPEPGNLLVLDENQKPVRCERCGQETVRAKSPVAERNYAVLYREIDWQQKPPRAKRHMCTGGR